jgi:peroxiredoxin
MKRIKLSILAIPAVLLLLSAISDDTGYKAGDKARDFKLKNTEDGKMVSLADYKSAKGFIVVFTCNHCPFAKAYEQRIMDLDNKYKPMGYPVIAISSNDKDIVPEDSPENMTARAKEKHYTFPYLYDESQEIAKTYGAVRTPHVFILAKNSKELIVKYIGAIDDNSEDASAVKTKYVENALSEIIVGNPVSVSNTKAIGCSIKWKKS